MDEKGPRDPNAFLLALSGILMVEPESLAVSRQVAAAAAAARSMYVLRRARLVRLTVVVVALSALFGSGSVAAAGRLPAPVQDVVADVARVIPIPLPIPYSTTSPETRWDGADLVEPNTPDGGLVHAVPTSIAPMYEQADIESASTDQSDPIDSGAPQEDEPCLDAQRDDDGDSPCETNRPDEATSDDDRRDRDRHEEEEADWEDTRDRDSSHSDEPDGERDRDRQDEDNDEEEERHDEHEDDQGSSDDEWREGHD